MERCCIWWNPRPTGVASMLMISTCFPNQLINSYLVVLTTSPRRCRKFGFTPEQLWEIPDTMGLIQSRTMASAGRTIRLPLNISESRETTTGRFLTTSSGAGVQHIAMATADMRKAIDQLAARGARFLPIPGNYYEDIEARWGLEP